MLLNHEARKGSVCLKTLNATTLAQLVPRVSEAPLGSVIPAALAEQCGAGGELAPRHVRTQGTTSAVPLVTCVSRQDWDVNPHLCGSLYRLS